MGISFQAVLPAEQSPPIRRRGVALSLRIFADQCTGSRSRALQWKVFEWRLPGSLPRSAKFLRLLQHSVEGLAGADWGSNGEL